MIAWNTNVIGSSKIWSKERSTYFTTNSFFLYYNQIIYWFYYNLICDLCTPKAEVRGSNPLECAKTLLIYSNSYQFLISVCFSKNIVLTQIWHSKRSSRWQIYAKEVAPSRKSSVTAIYRLRSISRSWIGNLDIRYLNQQQFLQFQSNSLELSSSHYVGKVLMRELLVR